VSQAEDQPGAEASSRTLSFTAFVLSLSTAALQQLGVPTTEGEDPCVDLQLAQQTIDILDMLQKKTEGNLSAEESKLLGNVLYDLRMRFVEASRGRECQ
jgi:hypothetical protein